MPSKIENAILSMHSYNVGYNAGIRVETNKNIGHFSFYDEVSRLNEWGEFKQSGFYAHAYQRVDDSGNPTGDIVISFRGTDNFGLTSEQKGSTDILNGMNAGAGDHNSIQFLQAIAFYEEVTEKSVYDQADANVTLVGHSLGGGLAQAVSAMNGATAMIFNNMPGILAAQAKLDEYIQSQRDEGIQIDDRTVVTSQIHKVQMEGDFLELVRNGNLQSLLHPLGDIATIVADGGKLLDSNYRAIVGPYLDPILEFISMSIDRDWRGAKTATSESLIANEIYGNNGVFEQDLFTAVGRHSQAFLVANIFGEGLTDQNWTLVAKNFLYDFLSSNVANAANILSTTRDYSQGNDDNLSATGANEIGSQMASAIAYTAMPGGSPFGDIAITAMFADANELGGAAVDILTEAIQWDWFSEGVDHLSRIIVANAGALAIDRSEDQSKVDGILSYENGSILLTGGNLLTKTFLEDAFYEDYFNWSGHQSESVMLVAENSKATMTQASTGHVAIGYVTGDHSTIEGSDGDDIFIAKGDASTFIGNGGKDTYHLKSGFNVVFTGNGDDYVNGGKGHDRINGSVGTDIIIGGDGRDTLSYANLDHGVKVTHDLVTSTFGVNTSYYRMEYIVGTDYSDEFVITSDALSTYDGGGGDDTFKIGAFSSEKIDNLLIRGGTGSDTATYSIEIRPIAIRSVDGGIAVCITNDDGDSYSWDMLLGVEYVVFESTGETIDVAELPSDTNSVDIELFHDSFVHPLIKAMPAFTIINNIFDRPVYSPLILDLDGDGVEVSSLTTSAAMFDMNLDGFAEHTAWVLPDDALLALDRNENGTIDDSSELFGSNVVNGFDILAHLDTDGDGVITASDAAYADLVLWKDANSDGLTDAGELMSLNDASIVSISLAAVAINETNEGNPVTHRSAFNWADGSTGTLDDVWFKIDPEYARDKALEGWTPSADMLAMPTLVSYGKAHNLLWSMDQDANLHAMADALVETVKSGDLVAFRKDFQLFVMEWLGVDPAIGDTGWGKHGEKSHLEVLTMLHGFNPPSTGGGDYLGAAAANLLELEYQHAIDSMAAKFVTQVAQNSIFEGQPVDSLLSAFQNMSFSYRQDDLLGNASEALRLIVEQVAESGAIDAGLAMRFILSTRPAAEKSQLIADALQDAQGLSQIDLAILKGYASSAVIINQDTENPWVGSKYGSVQNGTSGDDAVSGGGSENLYDLGAGNDSAYGTSGRDTYIYRKGYGEDSYGLNEASDRIIFDIDIHPSDVTASIAEDGKSIILRISPTDAITLKNVMLSNTTSMAISFEDGTLWKVQDIINDIMNASEGDDWLAGGDKDDVLSGEAGDDHIFGNNGNDLITGGSGDDNLSGGVGADIYVYELGDGHDTIDSSGDTYGRDIIQFGEGISLQDVTIAQKPDGNLHINLAQGGSINVTRGFISQSNQLAEIRFADGQIMTKAQILAATLTGGEDDDYIVAPNQASTVIGNGGSDELIGSDYDDILQGGAGDDILNGGRGADDLNGGDGNDHLIGGLQNDILIGGSGDDLLETGPGNDTIKISLGEGHDTVTSLRQKAGFSWIEAGSDIIEFDSGITASMVTFTQANLGKDLVIIIGGDQSVTFQGAVSDTTKISQIRFADGTVITGDQAATMSRKDTGGNDVIRDTSGSDVIDLGLGDDVIYSGSGNDTFLMDFGYGHDTIYETGAGTDTVSFADGITQADVNFVHSRLNNYDMVVKLSDGSTLILSNNPNGNATSYASIETFFFADGTIITATQARAAMDQPTEGDDVIRGSSASFNLLSGDDVIYASISNEVLDGGSGSDMITLAMNTVNWHINLETGRFAASGYTRDWINFENVIIGHGHDTIYGNSEGNIIRSNNGNDIIYGRGGANMIDAGAGNDIINSESSGDTITGGAGFDVFRFLSGLAGQNHTITDYEAGIDEIDLSAIGDMLELQNGNGFSWLGDDAFTSAAGQVRNGDNGLEIDIDGDGLVDISIATPVPVHIDDLFL